MLAGRACGSVAPPHGCCAARAWRSRRCLAAARRGCTRNQGHAASRRRCLSAATSSRRPLCRRPGRPTATRRACWAVRPGGGGPWAGARIHTHALCDGIFPAEAGTLRARHLAGAADRCTALPLPLYRVAFSSVCPLSTPHTSTNTPPPPARQPPVLRTATIRAAYSRQPLQADDGGTLALDWWAGADRPDYGPLDTPITLFIRGPPGARGRGRQGAGRTGARAYCSTARGAACLTSAPPCTAAPPAPLGLRRNAGQPPGRSWAWRLTGCLCSPLRGSSAERQLAPARRPLAAARTLRPRCPPSRARPDGINGGSHEGYIKWAAAQAAARGWRAVVLNLRGCNGLDVSSPRGCDAARGRGVTACVCGSTLGPGSGGASHRELRSALRITLILQVRTHPILTRDTLPTPPPPPQLQRSPVPRRAPRAVVRRAPLPLGAAVCGWLLPRQRAAGQVPGRCGGSLSLAVRCMC